VKACSSDLISLSCRPKFGKEVQINMSNKHTVVVILEAKQGKEKELESALIAVVNPSRAEESNIEYRLHKGIENPAQFVLYENWISKEEHQKQFSKPYILELGARIEQMLEKPYQVIFSEEI
tara:strand:- start:348 stop:713 length:366 start_codon:yes stop_codon:yes gene_type:complete